MLTHVPICTNICVNLLHDNQDVIDDINKSEFKRLLLPATQESFFIFNDVLYKQQDSVAMGSLLEPNMANAFLSFHKIKWLEQCPKECKPVLYRRYVEYIFLLFELAEHLSKFCDYFNTCHPNMSFPFEQEKKNGNLSFPNIEVSWKKGKFVTSVYRKPIFIGVYFHFDSFLQDSIQIWYDLYSCLSLFQSFP